MDRQQGQPGDDGTSGDLNHPSEHGMGQAGAVTTENVAAKVSSPSGQRDAELGDLHAASGVTIPAGFRRRTVLRKAEQPSPSEAEGREAAALNGYIINNGPVRMIFRPVHNRGEDSAPQEHWIMPSMFEPGAFELGPRQERPSPSQEAMQQLRAFIRAAVRTCECEE